METDKPPSLEIPEQPAPVLPPLPAELSPAVPWGPRDAWFGLALLVLWLVLSLATALVVGLLNLEWDISLLVTFLEALLLLPAWWLTVHKYKVRLATLGLRPFRFVMLLLAMGLLCVAYGINAIYALIIALLGVQPDLDLINLVSQLDQPWFLALGVVVVAPLAEEIFFRGFLFAGLRERYGWVWAALISAAIFSFFHLQLVQALPIFVLGFSFALIYEKSRSLWPAIAMHAAFNAVGLAAAYFLSRMGVLPGR